MFQSLFWWILYCDLTPYLNNPCWTAVSILVLVDLILWPSRHFATPFFFASFNPCFGGSHIVTVGWSPVKIVKNVSILVLVDLILWPRSWSSNNLSSPGFNPCFGGSHIVTNTAFTLIPLVSLFQSLFWWISYCDYLIYQNRFIMKFFNRGVGGSDIVTGGFFKSL